MPPAAHEALIAGIATNFEIVDHALQSALAEIEQMGGDLVTWLDESNNTTWAAGGAVVLLAGGGYYWQPPPYAANQCPSGRAFELALYASVHSDGAVMTSGATDRLLSKLNEGDADAAGQVFEKFEPFSAGWSFGDKCREKSGPSSIPPTSCSPFWATSSRASSIEMDVSKPRTVAGVPGNDDAQPLHRPTAAASPRTRTRMGHALPRHQCVGGHRIGSGERKLLCR